MKNLSYAILFVMLLSSGAVCEQWIEDNVLIKFEEGFLEPALSDIQLLYNVELTKSLGDDVYKLVLPIESDEVQVMEDIKSLWSAEIVFVDLNYYHTIDFGGRSSNTIDPLPVDWEFPFSCSETSQEQWGLADNLLNVCDAWECTKGTSDVVVIVIDAGVNRNHLELQPYGRVPMEGISFSDQEWFHDLSGHGTAIASIIWANHDEYGISGVAPNVRLWSWQVGIPGTQYEAQYPSDLFITALDTLDAISQENCDTNFIVNISIDYGSTINSNTANIIREKMESIVTNSGNVLFVAASGQDNSWRPGDEHLIIGRVVVPASFSGAGDQLGNFYSQEVDNNTIAVTSITASSSWFEPFGCNTYDYNLVAPFNQNWAYALGGESGTAIDTCSVIVDCVAPGGGHAWLNPPYSVEINGIGVYVADFEGGHYWKTGNSLAAPHVAGVAALVWSLTPGMNADVVKDIIRRSSNRSYINYKDDFSHSHECVFHGISLHKDHEFVSSYEDNCPHPEPVIEGGWTPGVSSTGRSQSYLDNYSSVVMGSGMVDAYMAVLAAEYQKTFLMYSGGIIDEPIVINDVRAIYLFGDMLIENGGSLRLYPPDGVSDVRIIVMDVDENDIFGNELISIHVGDGGSISCDGDIYFYSEHGPASTDQTWEGLVLEQGSAVSITGDNFIKIRNSNIGLQDEGGHTISNPVYIEDCGFGLSISGDSVYSDIHVSDCDFGVEISNSNISPELTGIIEDISVGILINSKNEIFLNLKNLECTGGYYGVNVLNANNITIKNGYFEGSTIHGIYAMNSTGVVLTDIEIRDVSQDGVRLDSSIAQLKALSLIDNSIIAVSCFGTSEVSMSDCIISGGSNGLAVFDSSIADLESDGGDNVMSDVSYYFVTNLNSPECIPAQGNIWNRHSCIDPSKKLGCVDDGCQ